MTEERRQRRRRHKVSGFPMNLDASLRMSGPVVVKTGDTTRTYAPLAPQQGEPYAIRVLYRCKSCPRPPAAEVEHFVARDGTEAVCFVGKVYKRTEDGRQDGFSSYAFIEPDYGAEVSCECPEHGPLEVDRDRVRRDVARSIDVERRQTRNGDEKATRTVRLRPRTPPSAEAGAPAP